MDRTPDRLVFATAHELAGAIRRREVLAVEVLGACLDQIGRHNPALNAIVSLDADGSHRRAREADEALAHGRVWGPLHGVPITLKDVHDTAGVRSTMGNPHLVRRIPAHDGVIAARLKAAGAILLGKTNAEMHPDNPFGHSRNPWDVERTPGESSSGAAVSLATSMTALDIGSDSGGSIVEPAHFCGVFGMRPTERRVPMAPFAGDPFRRWRILQVFGPMARGVADLRLALRLIAGSDGHDSEVPPMPWRQVERPKLHELRIAWAPTFPGAQIAVDVQSAVEELAGELQRLGARTAHVLPEIDWIEQAGWFIRLSELIENAGSSSSGSVAGYLRALDQRDRCIAAWERFFGEWDVLLCPAAETTALRRADAAPSNEGSGGGLPPHQLSPATGCPAVVLPWARDRNGMPIGVQLMGRRWADERLLAIAESLSAVTGGFRRPPGYSY